MNLTKEALNLRLRRLQNLSIVVKPPTKALSEPVSQIFQGQEVTIDFDPIEIPISEEDKELLEGAVCVGFEIVTEEDQQFLHSRAGIFKETARKTGNLNPAGEAVLRAVIHSNKDYKIKVKRLPDFFKNLPIVETVGDSPEIDPCGNLYIRPDYLLYIRRASLLPAKDDKNAKLLPEQIQALPVLYQSVEEENVFLEAQKPEVLHHNTTPFRVEFITIKTKEEV